MPPRLSKRQQRELEELEALTGPSSPSGGRGSESEEEEEEETPMQRHAAGFAALFAAEDGDEDDEEEMEQTKTKSRSGKSKKSKKKKKAASTVPNPEAAESPIPTPALAKEPLAPPSPASVPKSEKKALKKAKAKAKKAGKDVDGLDEIDRALSELSVKHPEFQKAAASSSSAGAGSTSGTNPLSRLPSLLSIIPSNLDSDAEMRKFFGAKVVAATRNASGSGSGGPSGAGRRAQAKLQASQRSNLVKLQNNWAPAQMRDGLSCRALDDDEVAEQMRNFGLDGMGQDAFGIPGEKWWTIEYSKRYKSTTLSFMRTVMSGDPNGFYGLLRKAPWHADTLLQLAEVFRHREEHAQAIDLISRAIFAYERAFIGSSSGTSSTSFSPLTGLHRLSFPYIPNRPFFLAIHRQVADYARRGLSRTAFEWAKLLWSLDWAGDPHGACFWLEILAPKLAGGTDKKNKEKEDGGEWLKEVWEIFEERRERLEKDGREDLRMDPSVLPGFTWSRALVLRMSGVRKEAATTALVDAIRSFPSIVPLLADKLEVEIPGSIRGHKDFKIEVDGGFLSTTDSIVHLLSHLYVQRAHSLWKDSSISSWFAQTLTEHFTSLPSSSIPLTPRRKRFNHLFSTSTSLQYAVYRHVIVSESTSSSRKFLSFIPTSVLHSSTSSLACDPLPPPLPILKSSYDETFFSGIEDLSSSSPSRPRTRRQREAEARMLARAIPDPEFRHQLEAVFDANPMMGQRFPEGIIQFLQYLQELEPDEMEGVLMALAMEGAGGQQEVGEEVRGEMPGGFELMFRDMDDEDPEVPVVFGEPGAVPIVDDVEMEDVEDEDDEDEEEEEQDIAPMPVRVLRNIFGRFWGTPNTNANADDSDSDEAEGGPPVRDTAGVD